MSVRHPLVLGALVAAVLAAPAGAQPRAAQAPEPSASATLVADNFFGFQAGAVINAAIGGRMVQGYGTYFTANFLGRGNGQNPWTEVGVGLPITTGAWTVTPRVGVVFGQLLSGGGNTGRPLAGEGIVPNVTLSRSTGVLVDAFAAYYRGLRSQGTAEYDFLHWNATVGIPAGRSVHVGGMIEQLNQTRSSGAGTVYRWVGPFAQIATGKGTAIRIAAGRNTDDGEGDFYKATFILPIP